MAKKVKALISEFLGSFFITFVSCYTFYLQNSKVLSISEATFANGILGTVVILSVFSFSSGHLNPGITSTLIILKKIPFSYGFFYIMAQIFGSSLAALTAIVTLPSRLSGYNDDEDLSDEKWELPVEERFQLSYCFVNPLLTDSQGFLIEFILCFAYALVFFSLVIDKYDCVF